MENVTKQKGPNRFLSTMFVVIYVLGNFVFLVSLLGNMPLLKDTIDMTNHQAFNTWFNHYYIWFCIIIGTIQIAIILYFTITLAFRSWPSLLAYVTSFYSTLTATISVSIIYVTDLRQLHFLLQILFVIPIILIFTSSVFLLDDNSDLLNNTYYKHVSKMTAKAQKRLERSRRVVTDAIDNAKAPQKIEEITPLTQNETLEMHRQRIADAAENAQPLSKQK